MGIVWRERETTKKHAALVHCQGKHREHHLKRGMVLTGRRAALRERIPTTTNPPKEVPSVDILIKDIMLILISGRTANTPVAVIIVIIPISYNPKPRACRFWVARPTLAAVSATPVLLRLPSLPKYLLLFDEGKRIVI